MDNTPGDKLVVWRDMRLADALVLINFNCQQLRFVTLKNLILIYMLYIGISYECCSSDNRCLTECIVAIGNSLVHRSSTPVESMDSPMNLTTV